MSGPTLGFYPSLELALYSEMKHCIIKKVSPNFAKVNRSGLPGYDASSRKRSFFLKTGVKRASAELCS